MTDLPSSSVYPQEGHARIVVPVFLTIVIILAF